ncbi:MAG: HD domain-containing protein [bacterium]|nr:HD domain-containing protein [bacterium]
MAESMRQILEAEEDERLTPWALRSRDAARRHATEPEGRAFDYRTRFQRDRDRIVYCRAFRRLRQKAQAGILPRYEDHRRNRLTHTLEVSQLARTIGRALRLNEDLIEAIALAHDLGQPPFGPIGARTLNDIFCGRHDGRGGPGLGDLGGFDRTLQGLRVVDELEKRYEHPGLNLTDPVREGILKSGGDVHAARDTLVGVRVGRPALFEAQVVALADRIAAALHDLDDALQAGTVEPQQVERLEAVRELRKKLGARYRARAGRFMKANVLHRGLTHLFVTGAILHTRRNLDRWAQNHGIESPEEFAGQRDDVVRGTEVHLPRTARRMLDEIAGFLEARVRRGYDADQIEARGRRVVQGLFAAYFADPTLLEDHVLLRFRQTTGRRFLRDLQRRDIDDEVDRHYRGEPRFARLLADHLAAMTDAYAIATHERLMGIGAVPIPGAEQLRREAERRRESD